MSRKADLQRARALLRRGGMDGDGWDSAAVPAANVVGAKDGVMVATPDGSVTVCVYRLRRWDDADTVQGTLKDLGVEGRESVSTSNGRLVMYATVDRNDPDAEGRLDQLLEAFAGRE